MRPVAGFLPGASSILTYYDATRASSPGGATVVGSEQRQLGADLALDSIYVFGWPYGAIGAAGNVARGTARGGASGLLRSSGREAVLAPKTLLYDASLPRSAYYVGQQMKYAGSNLSPRNLRTTFRNRGDLTRNVGTGLKEESFEEFAVEYPAEQFVPYAFGVTDSYSLVPTTWGDAAIPGASAGGFGLLQGAGSRRYRDGAAGPGARRPSLRSGEPPAQRRGQPRRL